MPRLEAADLSEAAFLRACELMSEIRAQEPDLSHRRLCQKALLQALLEIDAPAARAGLAEVRECVSAGAA